MSSPRSPAHNIRKTPGRQPTLSERVTQRLRGLGRVAATNVTDKSPPAPPLQVFDAEAEKPLNVEPRLDKGKGKATEADLTASPPPLSPSLPKLAVITAEPESEIDAENQKVLLAGLPFTRSQISALLTRAKAEMPSRSAKFLLLGEYTNCFTGEDFFHWLLEHVSEFQKDPHIVLEAARELTERDGLLRRVGELGNDFEETNDVFYQFRDKVPFV